MEPKKQMTKKEYDAKLLALREEQKALMNVQIVDDEEIDAPPNPRWHPAPGELFYGNKGDMAWDWSLWDGTDSYKLGCYSWGNVYKTKGEAIFAAERLKTIAEMREWAGAWDSPYAIGYNLSHTVHDIAIVDRHNLTHYGEMRFATREDAEKCIAVVGADRIKRYYFMIPKEENKECS